MIPLERLQIVQGDITRQQVDAIVNAANESLLGGGGVDGAIHRAAGPGLLDECRGLNGCATGQCKITAGHNLPARHVIHCVGPIWYGGAQNEDELLACCYRSALTIARSHGLKSLAFPAISTGIYRFPPKRAAGIALTTVRAEADESFDVVRFVCFDDRTADIYRTCLDLIARD